jgi:hypothetical protein
MIEMVYAECVPFWLCMGKKHCVAIALQQMEDFYQRIPSWLLQKVREERCQPVYNGTDKRGRPMASRFIDEIIETLMISYHQMSFRCTATDWRKHSVHMPLFRKCKAFHDSEYSKRSGIPSFEELYVDGEANGNATDKNNMKRSMTVPRSEVELAFISDLLTKADCCREVQGRSFKKDHFWEALKNCQVVVPERMDEYNYQQKGQDTECDIDQAAAALAGTVMDRTTGNGGSEGNAGLYDEAEMAAEFGQSVGERAGGDETVDDTVPGISDEDSDETEVTVAGKPFGKIRKAAFNPIATELVIKKGREMMEKMQISTLRNRMKCRLKREMKTLAQGLFNDLRRTGSSSVSLKKKEGDLPIPRYRAMLKLDYNKKVNN